MANPFLSVIDALANFPQFGGDIVGVFDSSFNQVFQNARPLKASVRETSRLLDHPIETGQVITDYSIIMPIEIDMPMVVESYYYRNTYQEIRSLYLNKELLMVQTRAGSYENMVISEIPHEEKPDMFDALSITIRMRQAQVVPSLTTYAPEDPTQSNTVQAGQQSGYVITGVATSNGVQTIPSGEGFSSIPPQTSSYTISGVQTNAGVATIPGATPSDQVQVSGVQTITPQQAIAIGFGGGGF